MPTISSPSTAVPAARPGLGLKAQALMAMALGLAIIGMVGFSQVDVLHNAAHDLRHSNGFPCH